MGGVVAGLGTLFSSGIGSTLGALGLGALTLYGANKMMSGMQNQQQSALVNLQNQNQSALDNLPEVPEMPTNDPEADSSAAEAARQKELAAIAAAEQENMVNPTGGLGAVGSPNTSKKELLGS